MVRTDDQPMAITGKILVTQSGETGLSGLYHYDLFNKLKVYQQTSMPGKATWRGGVSSFQFERRKYVNGILCGTHVTYQYGYTHDWLAGKIALGQWRYPNGIAMGSYCGRPIEIAAFNRNEDGGIIRPDKHQYLNPRTEFFDTT